MNRKINWLDRFFISLGIRSGGVDVPHRPTLNFAGSAVTVSDHETEDETRVTIEMALTGTEVAAATDAPGGAEALPPTPTGYLEVPINGVLRRVPFY